MSKTTYTPQGRIIEDENQGKALSDLYVMFHELISSRELIWRWFLRDFKARYRQTVLGVLWAILMPIITVGIFVGMNRSGVFQAGEMKVPYPLFALVGVTVWGVFSTALSSACSSLINAGSMLVKINFPKISLVITSTGQGLVDLLIKAALVCGLMLWYGIIPDPVGVFLAIPAIIPLYLLTLGMGFVFSLASGVLRDIPNIINVLLMIFMLFTPVLYIPPEGTLLYRMNIYNPLNYLVNGPRELLLSGELICFGGFMSFSIIAILIFFVGWRLFYVAQTKVAERL